MLLLNSVIVRGPVKIGRAQPATDAIPDIFSFDSVENANVSTLYSAYAQITGINTPTGFTVEGGEIATGNSAVEPGLWDTTALVGPNDFLFVRALSSADHEATVSVTVRAGAVGAPFRITTKAATRPNPFYFRPVFDVPTSTLYLSNAAQIVGTAAPVTATVTNAEIGSSTSADLTPSSWGTSVTLNPNDYLFVRAYSPVAYGATTNAVVSVGGYSTGFEVITYESGSFGGWQGNALSNAVTLADLAAFGSSFTYEPTAFWQFVDFDLGLPQTNLNPNTYVYGASLISYEGMTANIAGGEYAVTFTAAVPETGWTSNAIAIEAGQYLYVRVKSPETYQNWANATVTLTANDGLILTDTLCAQTRAYDGTPNAFSFASALGVVNGTVHTASAKITGFIDPVFASTTAGDISVSSSDSPGEWTPNAVLIHPDQYLFVRLTASSDYGTTTTATVQVGDVATTFSVRTYDMDVAPDGFAFPSLAELALGEQVTSPPVHITGINAPATVTTSTGEVVTSHTTTLPDPANWTSNAITITDGDYLFVRANASTQVGGSVDVSVHVGSNTAVWHLATGAAIADWAGWKDATHTANAVANPKTAAFASALENEATNFWRFMDFTLGDAQVDLTRNTTVEAQWIVPVSDITATITGGEIAQVGYYSAPAASDWTSNAITLSEGMKLCVRVSTSNDYSAWANATVTITDANGPLSSATLATRTYDVDVTPDTLSFQALSELSPDEGVVANVQRITGLNHYADVATTSGTVAVANTATLPVTGWASTARIDDGQYLFVRANAATQVGATSNVVVTVGTNSAVWSLTTGGEGADWVGWQDAQHAANAVANPVAADFESFDYDTTTLWTYMDFGLGNYLDVPKATMLHNVVPVSFACTATINGGDGEMTVSNGAGVPNEGWTSNAVEIAADQYLHVRIMTANAFSTWANTTITATNSEGVSVSATYATRTVDRDILPDDFKIANYVEVMAGETLYVAPVRITGINDLAAVTVSYGEFAVADTGEVPTEGWGVTGYVANGQYLFLRAIAATDAGGVRNASVTVGARTKSWSLTTGGLGADWVGSWDNDQFAANAVPTASMAAFGSAFTYEATDFWKFIEFDLGVTMTDTARNTVVYGAPYQIPASGITAGVSGGEIAVGGASTPNDGWTTSNITLEADQYIHTRLTTASQFSTWANATVTLYDAEGVRMTSASLATHTLALDATPDSFEIASFYEMMPGENAQLATLHITGINDPVTVSTTYGEVAVSDTSTRPEEGWATTATIEDGDYLFLRANASTVVGETKTGNTTVGTVTRSWSITTGGATTNWLAWGNEQSAANAVTTAKAANFASDFTYEPTDFWAFLELDLGQPRLNVELGETIHAVAAVSVDGLTATITNGQMAVSPFGETWRDYDWTSDPVTLVYGQNLHVRVNAATEYSTYANATVTILNELGAPLTTIPVVTRTYALDITPDAASIPAVYELFPGEQIMAAPLRITGINHTIDLAVTNGELVVSDTDDAPSAGWVTSATATDGQYLFVRAAASSTVGDTKVVTLSLGDSTTAWNLTTGGAGANWIGWDNEQTAANAVASATTAQFYSAFTYEATGYWNYLEFVDAEPQLDMTRNTAAYASYPVNVSGMYVSISGGETQVSYDALRVDRPFTAETKEIFDGSGLYIRVYSSNSYSTWANATVTVLDGDLNPVRSFTVATRTYARDAAFEPITIPTFYELLPDEVVTTDPIHITGINDALTVSISYGQVAVSDTSTIPTDGWAATATVSDGQYLFFRAAAAAAPGASKTATITIDAASYTWRLYTGGTGADWVSWNATTSSEAAAPLATSAAHDAFDYQSSNFWHYTEIGNFVQTDMPTGIYAYHAWRIPASGYTVTVSGGEIATYWNSDETLVWLDYAPDPRYPEGEHYLHVRLTTSSQSGQWANATLTATDAEGTTTTWTFATKTQ